MQQDTFEHKAKDWDKGDIRVENARTIADAIASKVKLNDSMEVIDFGVGTGLLGFEIAKDVKKVYGVDTSASMLEKLKEKNSDTLSIEPINQDIIKNPLKKCFDGLVSSMTLHHVSDLKGFFETIYKNLRDDGFIAIADLEEEDGTFHTDNSDVHHFGFTEEQLAQIVAACGFKNIEFTNINTIKKPHRDFGIFLLSAQK